MVCPKGIITHFPLFAEEVVLISMDLSMACPRSFAANIMLIGKGAICKLGDPHVNGSVKHKYLEQPILSEA